MEHSAMLAPVSGPVSSSQYKPQRQITGNFAADVLRAPWWLLLALHWIFGGEGVHLTGVQPRLLHVSISLKLNVPRISCHDMVYSSQYFPEMVNPLNNANLSEALMSATNVSSTSVRSL